MSTELVKDLLSDIRLESIPEGGKQMGQISDWFCANCLRTINQLSRHGRCPYCDSNAVDVASRLKISRLPKSADAVLSFELSAAHADSLRRNVLLAAIGTAKASIDSHQEPRAADAA